MELIVADDPGRAALEVFVTAAPRTVALAGGRTPETLYARLADAAHPWDETDVLFTDERCVPPGHPDSNHAMAHRALLSKVGARVHRMPGESCDPDAYEPLVREILGAPPRLDLAVLGLGADGHTASLFPGDAALEERDRWVVRVDRADHPRLTLTLPVLSAARVSLFLVAGEQKREALGRLLRGEDIPAARIRGPRVVVVADTAAAHGGAS